MYSCCLTVFRQHSAHRHSRFDKVARVDRVFDDSEKYAIRRCLRITSCASDNDFKAAVSRRSIFVTLVSSVLKWCQTTGNNRSGNTPLLSPLSDVTKISRDQYPLFQLITILESILWTANSAAEQLINRVI